MVQSRKKKTLGGALTNADALEAHIVGSSPRSAHGPMQGDERDMSMSDYTPTTDEVRELYVLARDTVNEEWNNEAEFDRWVAEVVATAKADALLEEAARTETHYTIDQKNKRHPRQIPVHSTQTREELTARANAIRDTENTSIQ